MANSLPETLASRLSPIKDPVEVLLSFGNMLDDVDSFERFVGRRRHSGDPGNRRSEIERDARLIGNNAGGHDIRPPDYRRHADAPFKRAAFDPRQGLVPGAARVAVVAGEDHDCVFRELFVFERLQQMADPCVHGLDHGDVDIRRRTPLVPERRIQRQWIGTVVRWSLKRRMRASVGNIQEKRLVFATLDELNGFVGHQIGEVPFAPNRVAVLEKVVSGNDVQAMEIAHSAADAVERVVKAMVMRRELRLVAQVPLAGDGGCIPSVFEQPDNRLLFRRQTQLVFFAKADGVVVPPHVSRPNGALQSANPLLIASRQERCSGGRAFGPIGIVICESDALFGELIQIGRLDVPATVAGQIAVAQIIGQDEDDVRSRGLGDMGVRVLLRIERNNQQDNQQERASTSTKNTTLH